MARTSSRSLTSLALFLSSALPAAFATTSLPPRIIQDPIFGLRKKRINDNTLPTALQQAFKTFFPH